MDVAISLLGYTTTGRFGFVLVLYRCLQAVFARMYSEAAYKDEATC